ncbi:hypothetical protein ABEI05_17250 [Erwinia billingiae]|uniref:hypothetical protein n=1 Tax=Erwinia billingiae TaxID=182337 RepID=UPI00320AE180
MKSQDILILLKIICLSRLKASDLLVGVPEQDKRAWDVEGEWGAPGIQHYDDLNEAERKLEYYFSVRGLAEKLGISKSEVSKSLIRCVDVNLAKISRVDKKHTVNKKVLFNFIKYGLKLVFPVKPKEITRGIPTAFAAPILNDKLFTAGDIIMVWPEPTAKNMGQSITPLYHSVPFAIRQDPELYSYLALIDAVRLGSPREINMAMDIIEERFFGVSV